MHNWVVNLIKGASVGLALFPEDGLEQNKLIEFVGLKMYGNKRVRKDVNLKIWDIKNIISNYF